MGPRVNLADGEVRVMDMEHDLHADRRQPANTGPDPAHPSSVDPLAGAFEVPTRSFEDWYRNEWHQVVSLVHVLSGSRWAAEELTQDAFVEAHKRWAQISGYDDPGAWVRRVAVNRARSWGRRRGAEARAYAKHLGRQRELPAELPPTADAFWAAVRSLPEKQAQIVALHYHDDRPVDDIARLLDIAPGTVKTQLHRARKALATRFDLDLDPTEEES